MPDVAKDIKQLVELYKVMSFVRVFDGKAIALQRTGKPGTYALRASAHEAAACRDRIGHAGRRRVRADVSRITAAQLYRGVKPREILLYWGGDERGNNFSGPQHDFAWSVPIATQALHAAGAALAFKIRKEPRVAVTVVGDGGTSKGDFYGAINVTGAMTLPMVCVIVNNQYAIFRSPQSADWRQDAGAEGHRRRHRKYTSGRQRHHRHARRTRSSPSERRARHGHGGSLIEAVTYRLSDHTTADDARRYRSEAEVKDAWNREPLKRLRNYLVAQKAWSDKE